MIVSRFRTALDLDTYPLSNFIRPRCAERAKRGRGKPVLIIHIEVSQCSLYILLFSLFSHHISRTQSFQQNRHISFPALVALNLLVSLISRLVARSAKIVVDKQTNKQTHRTTTVTLAAHARRGLIGASVSEPTQRTRCHDIYITAVPRAALSCAHARSRYPDIYTATSYRNHELGC